MQSISQDLRYAVRLLIKRPGFTIIALITFALGTGANTAVFSLVDAVLLRPLSFQEPDQLVMIWEDASAIGFPHSDVATANYVDFKAQQSSFEDLAALNWKNFKLSGSGEPERVIAHGVSANFFPLLGIQPTVGRSFNTDEDKQGAPKTAILGYGLWQRKFGGEQGIVGREILLNDEKYTVIGALPSNFQFLQGDIGLWVPIALAQQQLADRENHYLTVVGRMKPGVTIEQARADMSAIGERIASYHPKEAANLKTTIASVREELSGGIRTPLLVLLVAAGFVVLITCVNIAGLLLSRATARRKEMAIRTALGASRPRLVRQLLTESIVLALVGGSLGLVVALWSFAFLKQLIPPGMVFNTSLKLDIPVLAYAMLVSLVSGILCGLAPALQAARLDLNVTLKLGGRSDSAAGSQRTRAAFVIAEVAIALVLLVGAGLMIRTVFNLRDQYAGFKPSQLLTLRTELPDNRYSNLSDYVVREHPRRIAFYSQVLERVANLPGVVSCGYTTSVPLGWKGGANGFIIEGNPNPSNAPNAIHRQVSSSYFSTMGYQLHAGRFFDESDNQLAQPVAVINETMANAYWNGEEAIGKRFKLGVPNAPWVTIVGVVADVRQMGMDLAVKSEMYFPYSQISTHPWYGPRELVVRTASDPMSLVSSIRGVIRAIDPDQPIGNINTMEDILTRETGSRRLGMILLSVYAAVALMLASLGIYGVLSYAVAQQTAEIGVRMALGAQRSDILKAVVKRGMSWAGLGVLIGGASALALTRLMKSILFGVSATDPVTFGVIVVLLLVVSAAACLIPARRATRVDPMVSLRYE